MIAEFKKIIDHDKRRSTMFTDKVKTAEYSAKLSEIKHKINEQDPGKINGLISNVKAEYLDSIIKDIYTEENASVLKRLFKESEVLMTSLTHIAKKVKDINAAEIIMDLMGDRIFQHIKSLLVDNNDIEKETLYEALAKHLINKFFIEEYKEEIQKNLRNIFSLIKKEEEREILFNLILSHLNPENETHLRILIDNLINLEVTNAQDKVESYVQQSSSELASRYQQAERSSLDKEADLKTKLNNNQVKQQRLEERLKPLRKQRINLNSMIEIFTLAAERLKLESAEEELDAKKKKVLSNNLYLKLQSYKKLELILSQKRKLAEKNTAISAADLEIKGFSRKISQQERIQQDIKLLITEGKELTKEQKQSLETATDGLILLKEQLENEISEKNALEKKFDQTLSEIQNAIERVEKDLSVTSLDANIKEEEEKVVAVRKFFEYAEELANNGARSLLKAEQIKELDAQVENTLNALNLEEPEKDVVTEADSSTVRHRDPNVLNPNASIGLFHQYSSTMGSNESIPSSSSSLTAKTEGHEVGAQQEDARTPEQEAEGFRRSTIDRVSLSNNKPKIQPNF